MENIQHQDAAEQVAESLESVELLTSKEQELVQGGGIVMMEYP